MSKRGNTRRRAFAVGALMALCAAVAGADEPGTPEEPPVDALATALDLMGIESADLGYRPKAHWARYPHPKTVPYVLPFFEDLLANPLDTYEFTRTLGNAVEDLLTFDALTAAPTAKDRKETLFKLGVALGTDRRIGGFRGYAANLASKTPSEEPLFHALWTLLVRSGADLRSPMTFGNDLAREKRDPASALREQIETVPAPLRAPLARYVLDIVEAREWVEIGLRDVPLPMRRKVFAALPTLAEDTPDGTRYYPVIDDVAKRIDEHSLAYGCLKALQATQNARRALGALKKDGEHGDWPDFELRVPTPWGAVRFDNQGGEDNRESDPLLYVVFDNAYTWGPVGATSPTRSMSVALLLDFSGTVGDSHGYDLQKEGATANVAAGILGCGIVYASGVEPAAYRTGRWGLGAGLFGMGVLVDEGGSDAYKAAACAQGAAFFGAGLVLDAGGDDEYVLLEGDGQGFGGPGGVGVLADRTGDDTYDCEPLAAKAGRADYHSKDEIAVSNAQGVGSGRRGDGSDGHVWAGGLGALLDVDGDDTYRAGNFSQGLGYWYGTGLLWDGGGDDEYRSVYFTQGSGAHFAVGALIDESGNDVHVLEENAGAAFGFGWDVVNAFLIDRGTGNDRYEAKIISTGLAEVRSNAFFIDEGGDDKYVLNAKTKGFGDVDARKSYEAPGRTTTYPFHLGQVGVFLDLDGDDLYLRTAKDGSVVPDAEAKAGGSWNVRRKQAGTQSGPNVSCGIDMTRGVLGFLKAWPARKPSKASEKSGKAK